MGEPTDREAQKPAFKPLSAITLRNDQPIDPDHNRDDLLNFTPLARTIAGIAIGTEGPFTIGITAKWGHGKTSMLRLVKHLIERHGKEKKEAEWQATHVNVWFNAWQYEGEEQPIVPLLLAIQRAIANTKEEHRSRCERAGTTAMGWLNGIWCVLFSALYGLKVKMPGIELDYSEIIDKYEDELAEEPERSLPVSTVMQVVDALNEISDAREDKLLGGTAEDKPKIIIYIDDLDRCHPDTATRLLDGIKLILNQPGFIFILALDKTIIEEYLIQRYQKEFGTTSPAEVGSKYIEKIIQLEVPIPPATELSRGEAANYLHSLCADILAGLDYKNVPKILACFDTMNPRDATRFLLRTRTEFEAWVQRGKPKCKVTSTPRRLEAVGDDLKRDNEETDISEAQVLEGLLLLDLLDSAFPAAGKQRFVDLCSGPALCNFVLKLCEPESPPALDQVDSDLVRGETTTPLTRAIYEAVISVRGLRHALQTYGAVVLCNLAVRHLLRTGYVAAVRLVPSGGSLDTESQSYRIIREAVRLALALDEEDWSEDAWAKVKELNLAGQSELSDLEGLSRCSALLALNLGGTAASDVSPLSGLTSLRGLSLNNTQVSDVSPLSGLTSLQWLYLNGTQVSDVSPLSGLTSLQYLWLDNTQVSDVSHLSGLTSLQTLLLSNTEVSDVSHLSGLTSLELLDLSYTQVSEEDAAKLRKALPECRIYT